MTKSGVESNEQLTVVSTKLRYVTKSDKIEQPNLGASLDSIYEISNSINDSEYNISYQRDSATSVTSLESKCLNNMEPFFETLQVGLDSDYDSSLGDCGDSMDDYSFSDDEDDDNLHEQITLEYFHKPAQKLVSIGVSGINSLSYSNIPGLVASDDSSGTSSSSSSSAISNGALCTRNGKAHLSSSRSSPDNSSSSNKKARLELNDQPKHQKNRKRVISLQKTVKVIPIPQRSEYSSHESERLWSSSEEIQTNATRNSIEFASEGCDWRAAIEDREMLRHISGELIHPIHLRNALSALQTSSGADCCDQNMHGRTGHISNDYALTTAASQIISQFVPTNLFSKNDIKRNLV